MSHAEAHGHDHDAHGHTHDTHGHDHHDEKPHGFLNTVFDPTMGGFGIVWVIGLLIAIFLLMLLG